MASNDDSLAMESMESIKSNSIIKFDSLSSNRSKFWRLSEKTNLKTPPDNWLCGRFGGYNWSYPLRKNNSSMLSSFRMANNFTECVGSVDVIADSECIKKLLLMPFDSTLISLMVHRIGNSLLIDEFDLAKHLIHNESKQWSWLKRFIDDMIVPMTNTSMIAKKPITRDVLQSKNMFCKFLHYSVDQNHSQTDDKAIPEDNLQLSPKKSSQSEDNEIETKDLYFSHYNKDSEMSDIMTKQLDRIEDKTQSKFTGFVRNVLWTFEDIRMLVASNLPIFGDVNHPAVSLRLHDMKSPINVLTGMDYWLDNLMSSVPEVVMCYHLEGIVQKYELIKTEDIPKMSSSKGSSFSPKVIQNIAQNILSFMKSKATKSGHTYWLFKGKYDDVVKLYDLTALCTDYMQENDSNPYAIPVAMLLYRVAKNMKNMRDTNQSKHSPNIDLKIHKLLDNCLSLLDPKKHPQIVSSAHYLLSDVYVPNDIDPTFLPLGDKEYAVNKDDEDFDFDDFDSTEESSDESNCATLDVNKLGDPGYYKSDRSYKKHCGLEWNVKCERALKHIIDGLNVLIDENQQKDDIFGSPSDEAQRMANPREPIPLNYDRLHQNTSICPNGSISGKELTQITAEMTPNWRTCLEVCLLQKGAQVFCILAELADSKAYGMSALKYIRMGVMCYEMAIDIIEKTHQNNYLKEPIACLLALCGDIHLKILKPILTTDDTNEDNDNICANELFCNQLKTIFEKLCKTELKEEFRWAYKPVINSENVEQRLMLCYRCYEEALFQLNDVNHCKEAVENTLHERLMKRLGYICNEMANYYMNESRKHFNQTINTGANEQNLNESEVNRLNSLTDKSLCYFEKAVDLFRRVKDKENTSLMLSNLGSLMRTCAHIFAPTFRQNSCKEFSTKEKRFLLKAIDYYNSALNELGKKGKTKYKTIYHNINWELSTTLFTVGSLMQEFAPLSTQAFEVVEEEISKYLIKALNLCKDCEKSDTSRHVLYQFRAATVCHRLASLYHNSYRNMSEESERRKKTYNLSDDYYQTSRSMYRALNDKEEYLRVTLEEISLHESNLSQLNGFSSKLKALHLILAILLTIADIDFTDIESDDERQKIEEMLDLCEARIQLGVKGLIKCLSTKTSKYKDLIQKWKAIEEIISKTTHSKKLSIHEKLDIICQKLISSQLIDSNTK